MKKNILSEIKKYISRRDLKKSVFFAQSFVGLITGDLNVNLHEIKSLNDKELYLYREMLTLYATPSIENTVMREFNEWCTQWLFANDCLL